MNLIEPDLLPIASLPKIHLNFTTSGRVVYKEKIYPAKVTANLSLVATTLWTQEELMDMFLI